MFDLAYMSRGNKAAILSMITVILTSMGIIMFFIGPQRTQAGLNVLPEDFFYNIPYNTTSQQPEFPDMIPPLTGDSPPPTPVEDTESDPAATPQPSTGPPAPTAQPVDGSTPQPTLAPTTLSPTAQAPATQAPVITATLPPTTHAPLPMPVPAPQPGPAVETLYPFATVYECDWAGNRVTLTTKTKSSSLIRLCIEAPRPGTYVGEQVEMQGMKWFVFNRQEIEGNEYDEPLEPMTQHAVIDRKVDPFGRTVLDCDAGTPVCKFGTVLRESFFEEDAFLLGKGELELQFVQSKTTAGISPVSIIFLLSSIDIKEPLQLGRTAKTGTRQRPKHPASLFQPP
jgi:hypothetical protein